MRGVQKDRYVGRGETHAELGNLPVRWRTSRSQIRLYRGTTFEYRGQRRLGSESVR